MGKWFLNGPGRARIISGIVRWVQEAKAQRDDEDFQGMWGVGWSGVGQWSQELGESRKDTEMDHNLDDENDHNPTASLTLAQGSPELEKNYVITGYSIRRTVTLRQKWPLNSFSGYQMPWGPLVPSLFLHQYPHIPCLNQSYSVNLGRCYYAWNMLL